MKKIVFLNLLVFLTGIFFYSCDKSGCTDPDSINYDPKAVKDDGSCEYQGSAIFWYDNTTKMKLLNSGVINLNYFVDGYKVGTAPVTAYSSTEPNCGKAGLVTVVQNMGKDKMLTLKYEVYEAENPSNLHFSGNIVFKANQCVKVRLIK